MSQSPSPRSVARLGIAVAIIFGFTINHVHATSGPGCFRITGVASNDVLNLRAAPKASAALTGTMHPNRHGIIALSGRCTPEAATSAGQWCKVTHFVDSGTTIGWASRRFLEDVDCP